MLNKSSLLTIAVFLLVLKFILVPWLAYQNEQHNLLEVVSKRLERATMLLAAGDAVQDAYSQLEQQSKLSFSRIVTVSDAQAYRLTMQQMVQKQMAEFEVTLIEFNWVGDIEINELDVSEAIVSIRITGNVLDVARWHSALEESNPHISVQDLAISTRKKITVSDDVNANFILQIVYRVVP